MILDRVRRLTYQGETHDGEPDVFDGSGGRKMPVTVVFTTIEGTLAGLNAAARLSAGLGGRIVVLVTEVVSFRYMFQGLADAMAFFQRLCAALVKESNLEDVGIEVHLCHDQIDCLAKQLQPRSIVLIGVRRCWWPWRERHLERALNRRGFKALLVHATSSLSHVRSESVVQRMVLEANRSQQ